MQAANQLNWVDVEDSTPEEGVVVICWFPHMLGPVYYMARFFEDHGFISESGNYAPPEKWAYFEGPVMTSQQK